MLKNHVYNETKKIIKSSWKLIIKKIVTTIFLRSFLLIIPIIFSGVINDISKNNFDNACKSVIFLIIITIFYYVSEYVNQIAYYRLYNFIYSRYSILAMKAASKNSIFSLSRFSLGEYTNILNNDISTITTFFSSCAIWIIRILEFIYIYYFFLSIDIYIFIITIILSLFMILISILSGGIIEKKNLTTKLSLDEKTAMIHEMFLGIKEIKCLNIFNKINSMFIQKCNKYLQNNANYNVHYNAISYLIYGIISIVRFIIVLYSIKLIINGKMEIGALLIIYEYYGKIIDNFSVITSINVEMRNLNVSLMRFNKILENSYNNKIIPNVVQTCYEGKIHFEKIFYGYKDNPTLKNVTFDIP